MSRPSTSDVNGLIGFVRDWRSAHGIAGQEPLTKPQLVEFVGDLHKELTNFSLRPEKDAYGEPSRFDSWRDDAKVIPYSGNAGDVPCWKLVSAMSANGEGEVFYISDTPAGRALNEDRLRAAVVVAAGGADRDMGKTLAGQIFDGPWEDGVRSKYAVDNMVSLNDFVSDRLMREMAAGDVHTATPGALPDRVFVQTELPALLECPRVTAINGIPVDSLRQTLEQTGSLEALNQRVRKPRPR